mgnify:CR=1 FL=1
MIVLLFSNSVEKLDSFKFNSLNLCLASVAFVCGFLSLSNLSEFLYFNF